MIRYLLSRLLLAIPVLLIIATATFFMIRLAPGGPFDEERQLPEDLERNIQVRYNLDWPLWKQYLQYMGPFNLDDHGSAVFGGDGTIIWGGIATGDLGPSYRYAGRTVNEIIAASFPVSLELGCWAMMIAIVTGGSAGLLASQFPGTWRDYVPMTLAMTGICTPNFVLGPLLVLLFAIHVPLFNVAGWETAGDRVLPAITLGAAYAAYIARLMRGGMLEIMRQDFIRTAEAKGLPRATIVFRHAFKGGVLPTVSFMGPALAGILTGSLIIELIFDIPGLGRFFVQSALNRDYTMVMGTAIFYAVFIVGLNIFVDIAYAFLDPHVRYRS